MQSTTEHEDEWITISHKDVGKPINIKQQKASYKEHDAWMSAFT